MIGDEQSALGLTASTDIEIFKGRKMRACLSLRSLGTPKPCDGQQQNRTLTTE